MGKRIYGFIPNVDRLSYRADSLKTCFRLEPEMETTLRSEVYPYCAPVTERQSLVFLFKFFYIPELFNDTDPNKKYAVALRTWADNFQLNHVWVLQTVSLMLQGWRSGQIQGIESWVFDARIPPFVVGPPFVCIFPGWIPSFETREDAQQRIQKALKNKFEKYFDKMVNKSTAANITPAKKRRKKVSDPEDRMEWIVRYHVQKWSPAEIAAHYQKCTDDGGYFDESHVKKAVKELAEIIGIDVSKQRGRPRRKSPKKGQ